MPLLSRFRKEQALRAAGVGLPPYPAAGEGFDSLGELQTAHALLAAGTAWEAEVDRLYLQLIASTADSGQVEFVCDFMAACEAGGLTSALASLNARVAHRFTAVYELGGALLRNIELVDKAGEARPEFLKEVPLGSSFCQFVLRDGMFLTGNSGQDDRLDGHPYKGVMVAYHGVPIAGVDGRLFGTLCHFDVIEQPLSDDEFNVLRSIARVLPAYLKSSVP